MKDAIGPNLTIRLDELRQHLLRKLHLSRIIESHSNYFRQADEADFLRLEIALIQRRIAEIEQTALGS
jgi:hypothetical protein